MSFMGYLMILFRLLSACMLVCFQAKAAIQGGMKKGHGSKDKSALSKVNKGVQESRKAEKSINTSDSSR